MKKAVIFDFDGTIANTMSLHNDIELEILHRYGIDIDRDILRRTCAGVPFAVTMTKLFKEHGVTDANPTALMLEKRSRMLKNIETNLKPMPDLVDVLNMLKDAGHTLAVGTSSCHAFVDKSLHILGLNKYFDVVVCIEDVNNVGKPAPDIFLRCAKLLNRIPQECVVVEDGVSGILAAKNANMKSIGFAYDQNPKDFPADIIISDFCDLKLEDFD